MTCPLGMNVWPEQNSQEGDGTSRKVLAAGSQTFGFPSRLQVRTLASYSNATWMGTTGQVWGSAH